MRRDSDSESKDSESGESDSNFEELLEGSLSRCFQLEPMDGSTGYQVYSVRWLVLSSFSVSNAFNAFLWITFASIFDQCSALWGLPSSYINGLSLVFLLLFLPGTVLTSFCVERYGVRAALVVGTALNCIGAWVRWTGALASSTRPLGFALVMLGQCLAGFGQPLFTNLPARISADWFPASQRDIATTVASLSNALGVAAGSVVPTLAVSTAGDIAPFLLVQAAVSTVFLAITIFGVRSDRPPTPPSASAALRLDKATGGGGFYAGIPLLHAEGSAAGARGALASSAGESPGEGGGQQQEEGGGDRSLPTLSTTLRAMASSYWGLLVQPNYLRLCIGFGIGLGLFNALLTLLSQLIAPCGYSNDFGGEAGGVLLGAGLLSAAVVGVVLEKTRAYISILRGGILAATCATLFFLGSLRRSGDAQLMAACAVLGAVLIPMLPISLENAAECTYPVAEEVSSGLMLIIGNYIGLVLIVAMQAMIPAPSGGTCTTVFTPFAGVFFGVIVIALISVLLFQKDYRRQKAEAAGRSGEGALEEI